LFCGYALFLPDETVLFKLYTGSDSENQAIVRKYAFLAVQGAK
jgi:hypothetical protein